MSEPRRPGRNKERQGTTIARAKRTERNALREGERRHMVWGDTQGCPSSGMQSNTPKPTKLGCSVSAFPGEAPGAPPMPLRQDLVLHKRSSPTVVDRLGELVAPAEALRFPRRLRLRAWRVPPPSPTSLTPGAPASESESWLSRLDAAALALALARALLSARSAVQCGCPLASISNSKSSRKSKSSTLSIAQRAPLARQDGAYATLNE